MKWKGCILFSVPFQEKGNEYVKTGKKHYSDAIDCYTRAIDQKALSDSENSILYSNRAHVNLLLGNYRRALQDAEEAIKLCPTNVKVVFSCSYLCIKSSISVNYKDLYWHLGSLQSSQSIIITQSIGWSKIILWKRPSAVSRQWRTE